MADDATPDPVSCPHCGAGESLVWDSVLFHYAHPDGDKLKLCWTPWSAPSGEFPWPDARERRGLRMIRTGDVTSTPDAEAADRWIDRLLAIPSKLEEESLRRIVRTVACEVIRRCDLPEGAARAAAVAEVSDLMATRVVEQLVGRESSRPRAIEVSSPEQVLAAAHDDQRRELRFSDLQRAIASHREERGDEFLAAPVVLRVEDSEGELHVGGLYDLAIECHVDEPALVLDAAQDVVPA